MEKICKLTKTVMTEWKNPYGWAPDSASEKICAAMKSWIIELTDCLNIWHEKSITMTDGELILAKTNLGSLIESWLKFFYCVYYEDYLRNPNTKRDGTILEPNNMSFEQLKIYSRGILWDQGDNWDVWVEKMQHHRNAIHAFNFRDIGSSVDYSIDIDCFYEFINLIVDQLPDSPKWGKDSC